MYTKIEVTHIDTDENVLRVDYSHIQNIKKRLADFGVSDLSDSDIESAILFASNYVGWATTNKKNDFGAVTEAAMNAIAGVFFGTRVTMGGE